MSSYPKQYVHLDISFFGVMNDEWMKVTFSWKVLIKAFLHLNSLEYYSLKYLICILHTFLHTA